MTLPTIAEIEAKGLSGVGEAADRLGTLEWPRYVWGYDFTDGRRLVWGTPVPLVQEAQDQLDRYNAARL